MEGDTLVVPRAEFAIEEPWRIPPVCQPVELRRSTDGAEPRLKTITAVYAGDGSITFVFNGRDDQVVATHLEHDAPLYQEDVVEVFLSPNDDSMYFEIEVNPIGTSFDARIASPDGVRATMQTDLAWTCENLFAAVRRTQHTLDIVIRFPFASIGASTPPRGATWRGNLFRIDRSARGDEFMAWRPTMKTPPDFHIMAAFGRMRFD